MLRARRRLQSKSHEARSHSRLSFFAQLQRFYLLPLLVGLHGNTETISQKSANKENTFCKVTLPSAIIFSAKDACTINFTSFFYFYFQRTTPICRTRITRTPRLLEVSPSSLGIHPTFNHFTRLTRTRILEFPADSKLNLTQNLPR